MYEYKLSNSTRIGLLNELRDKGFMWGSSDEVGVNFTEQIPDMWEQAQIRPFGCTAVYLEKLPNGNKWHVDVISPNKIDFNPTMVETVLTPYNSMA